MVNAAVVTSQTPLERATALKKDDGTPRQKYTRLFWTDSTGKITAFTIKLFERTATGENGKQLAYTQEQWKEIVKEKTEEMKLANAQAATGSATAPDLFTGIAGFQSSANETDGVTYSIPTTTPASSGSPTPSTRKITIPTSKNRAREFNIFAQAMEPRYASELSDSRVSPDRSERASLRPEWWDPIMTEDLKKEDIDDILAARSIGIKRDGETCFINTMFNAFILHDRELIDALLAHRHDEPTKQIAMYLYNYIKHRKKEPADLLPFRNTEQFRNDLNQINPEEHYISGQHDPCKAYQSLRAKVIEKSWLTEDNVTETVKTFYGLPKNGKNFQLGDSTHNRPKEQTAKEKKEKKPVVMEPTNYTLTVGSSTSEAYCERTSQRGDSQITVNLPKTSKTPLKLDELLQQQLFIVPSDKDSATVLRPVVLKHKDGKPEPTPTLQPCKELRQERLLSKAPKMMIININRFPGGTKSTATVDVPIVYTFPANCMEKVSGADQQAASYDLKAATVRLGDTASGGGHYYSYDKRGSIWYHTNDSTADPIDETAMLKLLQTDSRDLVYIKTEAPV